MMRLDPRLILLDALERTWLRKKSRGVMSLCQVCSVLLFSKELMYVSVIFHTPQGYVICECVEVSYHFASEILWSSYSIESNAGFVSKLEIDNFRVRLTVAMFSRSEMGKALILKAQAVRGLVAGTRYYFESPSVTL
jgi:hypothetical protein